jgi:predicted nucleic acid-binding protein
MNAPLDSFLEGEIYVDTMIFYIFLIPIPKLQALAHFPNLDLVEITPHDVPSMLRNILQHSLKLRDALHLAVMERLPCYNLASGDHRFDAAPRIKRYSIKAN